MNYDRKWQAALLWAAMAVAVSLPFAWETPAVDSGAVTMTVTAVGKKETQPPALTKDDVQLYQGKEKVQVADWKRGDTLFLAVLIDDSLQSAVANQWGDLKAVFHGTAGEHLHRRGLREERRSHGGAGLHQGSRTRRARRCACLWAVLARLRARICPPGLDEALA